MGQTIYIHRITIRPLTSNTKGRCAMPCHHTVEPRILCIPATTDKTIHIPGILIFCANCIGISIPNNIAKGIHSFAKKRDLAKKKRNNKNVANPQMPNSMPISKKML